MEDEDKVDAIFPLSASICCILGLRAIRFSGDAAGRQGRFGNSRIKVRRQTACGEPPRVVAGRPSPRRSTRGTSGP